jgi:hypothetical protein
MIQLSDATRIIFVNQNRTCSFTTLQIKQQASDFECQGCDHYCGNLSFGQDMGLSVTFIIALVRFLVGCAANRDEFTQLTSVPTEAFTLAPNVRSFNVTNRGMSAYIVDGLENPDIIITELGNYSFHVDAAGHPFWIRSVCSCFLSISTHCFRDVDFLLYLFIYLFIYFIYLYI